MDGVVEQSSPASIQAPITVNQCSGKVPAIGSCGTINGSAAWKSGWIAARQRTLARIILVEKRRRRRPAQASSIALRPITPHRHRGGVLIIVPPLFDGVCQWFQAGADSLVVSALCAGDFRGLHRVRHWQCFATGSVIKGGAFLEAMGGIGRWPDRPAP